MVEETLYEDKLIKITNQSILLKKYYFPTLKSKNIPNIAIDYIKVVKPTLLTGKFRYWGTTDLTRWFPMDFLRSKRDAIFILNRKNKRILVCFTVEDAQKVKEILEKENLLLK